jgi:hypothetical protein
VVWENEVLSYRVRWQEKKNREEVKKEMRRTESIEKLKKCKKKKVKDEDKKRNEETTGRNTRGWGRFCQYKVVLPQGGESALQGRNTRLLLLRSLDEKCFENSDH